MTTTGLAWGLGAAAAPASSGSRPGVSFGRGAGGGSLVGRRELEIDARDHRARPALRTARLHAHRTLGVDDDARLAGREEAIAVGLDQTPTLLARPLGQPKARVGNINDDAVGISQQEVLIGRVAGEDERKARARLVPGNFGADRGHGAILHLGRPCGLGAAGRSRRGGLRNPLPDLAGRKRPFGRKGLPHLRLRVSCGR